MGTDLTELPKPKDAPISPAPPETRASSLLEDMMWDQGIGASAGAPQSSCWCPERAGGLDQSRTTQRKTAIDATPSPVRTAWRFPHRSINWRSSVFAAPGVIASSRLFVGKIAISV